MAEGTIGYVGRGRYGEPTFRVTFPEGHYDDVVGDPVYRPNQNRNAPSQRLLQFADTEVQVKAGIDKTMPYKIISVISDTKDGINFDRIGRNEYGFLQKNPTIVTKPDKDVLVPEHANHSQIADQIPQPDGALPIDEFFSKHSGKGTSFETPDIPEEVEQEMEALRVRAEKAEKKIESAKKALE